MIRFLISCLCCSIFSRYCSNCLQVSFIPITNPHSIAEQCSLGESGKGEDRHPYELVPSAFAAGLASFDLAQDRLRYDPFEQAQAAASVYPSPGSGRGSGCVQRHLRRRSFAHPLSMRWRE